jgi:hypothetical protein
MAKFPKDEDKKEAIVKPDQQPVKPTELLIAAQRKAAESRAVADADADAEAKIESDIAKTLIEQHKGARITIGGVTYQPKRSAERTSKKTGEKKAPAHPYQLVRVNDRETVAEL